MASSCWIRFVLTDEKGWRWSSFRPVGHNSLEITPLIWPNPQCLRGVTITGQIIAFLVVGSLAASLRKFTLILQRYFSTWTQYVGFICWIYTTYCMLCSGFYKSSVVVLTNCAQCDPHLRAHVLIKPNPSSNAIGLCQRVGAMSHWSKPEENMGFFAQPPEKVYFKD